MERLGTPWYRRSPIRVFRDDSSLPASSALWPEIEAGLKESQYFVLLASPAAAASTWVDKEVAWWLAHRQHERLLIVVTGGRITYDGAQSEFDWRQTDCLPSSLRGIFAVEPLWIDLRFAAGRKSITLRQADFRNAALGIAAAIRDIAKDDLESADSRQHRHSTLAAIAGAFVLGLLALMTITYQRIVRGNHLEAESRRLAAEALEQLDNGRGIEAATLKAAIAWRLAPTSDARRALARIDKTTADVARVLSQHTAGAGWLTFSRDGKQLITAGREGAVLQWSLDDGRAVGLPLAIEPQWVKQLKVSRDGTQLMVYGARRKDNSDEPTLTVLRFSDGTSLPIGREWLEKLKGINVTPAWFEKVSGTSDTPTPVCAAISPSGKTVAVLAKGIGVEGSRDTVELVDTASGMPTMLGMQPDVRLISITFKDEQQVAVLAQDKHGFHAGRINLASGRVVLGAGAPSELESGFYPYRCDFANFSDDASRVAAWSDYGLVLWRIDEDLTLHKLPVPKPTPRLGELTGHYAPALDGTGRRVAYGLKGTAYVWDADAQQMIVVNPFQNDSHGPYIAVSPDGLAAALDGYTPVVWRLDNNAEIRAINASQCGNSGLENICIQRLCERITVRPDDARWHELLGSDYANLVSALRGTSCARPADKPLPEAFHLGG